MSNRILSYKGLLADNAQDTILLSTKKGEVGYRIRKLEIMTQAPFAGATAEHVIKVWKEQQTTPYTDSTVDFSDNRLIGTAITTNHTTGYANPVPLIIVFDTTIFNQDIYITHTESSNSQGCNYYLELEVIKLDESQAMVTTLQDIRNNS